MFCNTENLDSILRYVQLNKHLKEKEKKNILILLVETKNAIFSLPLLLFIKLINIQIMLHSQTSLTFIVKIF